MIDELSLEEDFPLLVKACKKEAHPCNLNIVDCTGYIIKECCLDKQRVKEAIRPMIEFYNLEAKEEGITKITPVMFSMMTLTLRRLWRDLQ